MRDGVGRGTDLGLAERSAASHHSLRTASTTEDKPFSVTASHPDQHRRERQGEYREDQH
jgi:hypothetical protein